MECSIVLEMLICGLCQVEKDERSDTEAESDEEDDNITASASPLLNGRANGKKIVINNNMYVHFHFACI